MTTKQYTRKEIELKMGFLHTEGQTEARLMLRQCLARIDQLEAEPSKDEVERAIVEKLVEALKFYASDLRPGDGDVAREALQLLPEGK